MQTLRRKRKWRRLATLCVIGTALVGLGIGIVLNVMWTRYIPQEEKSVSRLIKELEKQDSAFDLAWMALWPKFPGIIRYRFSSWEPSPTVEIRRAAAAWLAGSSGKTVEAVPALRRAVSDSDLSVRISAIEALGAMGSAAEVALPELVSFFENEQNDPIGKSTVVPRGSAAIAIASIGRGQPRSVRILTRGLERELGKGRASLVAPFIVRALEGIATEQNGAVSVLLKSFSGSDDFLKVSIINSLGRLDIRGEEIVPMLIRVLNSRSAVIRLAAVNALGNVGSNSDLIVPALLRLFQRTSLYEKSSNEEGIGIVSGRAEKGITFLPPSQIASGVYLRTEIVDVPRIESTVLVEMNVETFWSQVFAVHPGMNPEIAENAVRPRILVTLGKLGSSAQEAIEPLSRYYQDPSSRFRCRAARIRWEIDGNLETVIPCFLDGLAESDPKRRLEVLRLVEGMSKQAYPVLQTGAIDADARVREASINQADEAGPEALPLILDALEDSSMEVRVTALRKLRELGSAAFPFVARIKLRLNDPKTSVQRAAAMALKIIDPSGSSKWNGVFRE